MNKIVDINEGGHSRHIEAYVIQTLLEQYGPGCCGYKGDVTHDGDDEYNFFLCKDTAYFKVCVCDYAGQGISKEIGGLGQ